MSDAPDAALAERLEYAFRDPALLETALTHPSFAHEQGLGRGNERLEFLGDAVLDLVVAELLFEAHPDWPEGDLTRARAALVNRSSLAGRARALALDGAVRLGGTELRSHGHRKDRILANCLEAVIGAIYLDGGLEPVATLARRLFGEALEAGASGAARDPKTALQEWAHGALRCTPRYDTVGDSGTEDDARRFTVEVRAGDEVLGRGIGRSKRAAERAAAADALEGRDRADG